MSAAPVTELHRALDALECRILGCLVEKEMSTPDAYPLTVNALTAACNQTTNRDPVIKVAPRDLEEVLLRLMADVLVWRERGARSVRWKHALDRKLDVDAPRKAVLAELLLRGPQTPGELRSRTARMHDFRELSEVEEVLRSLAGRGLVEELPRSPGQKERRWQQLLGDVGAGAPPAPSESPGERDETSHPTGSLADRVALLERRIEELETRLAALED